MPAQGTDRLIWLDTMRLLAGLSMVGLHATADITGQPFVDYDPSERIAPMLLRAVLYIARTELFLMISVFLLLLALQSNQRTYRQTINVQARRLLVPFGFWTVFYALYSLLKAYHFGYGEAATDRLLSLSNWISFLLLGTSKYHMHFIPTLFGLLLMYPLFRVAQRHPVLGLSVIAGLMIKREADLYAFQHYWGHDALPYLIRGIKLITYASYGMAAAALLALWQRSNAQACRPWLYPILICGAVLCLLKLTAIQQTIASGQWAFDHTAGYWADFLMPVLLFGLCLCLGYKNWPPVLSRLAPYAFGIYLCHPIFLDLAEMLVHERGLSPMQMVMVKIGLTLPLTCGLVLLLSRSRALAWIIGMGPLPRPHTTSSANAI